MKDKAAEQIRYIILGYMSSVLLNSEREDTDAARIMSFFVDNFYDSKYSGLVLSCYSCFF